MDKLHCDECGSELKISIGYTGTDWESEAGEGSGYKFEMSLDCTNDRCARIYILGYLRNDFDFSPKKSGSDTNE